VLAAAIVGVMIMAAACGSVTAGPGSHPGAGAAAPAGSPSASAGSQFAASQSAASPSASAGSAVVAAVPLCVNAAHLDRMVVSLGPGIMPGFVREAQPAGVTIADPARVRVMAAALCRLPAMAQMHMLCPSVHAGVYRLTFSAAGRVFPQVTVEASGCHLAVYGLGPARAASGSFIDLLRRDLGHSHGVVTPVPVAP
jgi:hypothetical protein